jgi:hypothetical protein
MKPSILPVLTTPKGGWSILLQAVQGASRSLFLFSGLALLTLPEAKAVIDTNNNGVSDVWERIYPTAAANLSRDHDGKQGTNPHGSPRLLPHDRFRPESGRQRGFLDLEEFGKSFLSY